MSRRPMAIAAVGLALGAPSSALAMHGPREQAPRLARDVEFHGSFAQTPLAAAPGAAGSFSWLDAGIGASVTGGFVLVLAGSWRVVARHQRHIRLHHVS